MTDEQRTAVCCLSSLNIEKYDEWKDAGLVEDLVTYLDNVLEYFIALAPKEVSRAIYSAKTERAIGMGSLGFHSYLQSKGIPFESGGFNSAVQENYKIYKNIKKQAIAASLKLGGLRGEPKDCKGSGMRNSHLMAIAPNASSSSLIGVSPSIEPFAANAFTSQGRAGAFLIKNKHLDKIMKDYATNNDKSSVWIESQWNKIVNDDGSVQNLDWLDEHNKKVFRTFSEIDQMYVIEHASTRQPHVCQGQSVNISVTPDVTKQQLSDLHMKAWRKGLKGLYYCRSNAKVKAKVNKEHIKQPLNSVDVTTSYEGCLSCEG
tara:strand:- start:52 stop:1002 length:951 start_codon:yes stop_codon:yes gene_type:complete